MSVALGGASLVVVKTKNTQDVTLQLAKGEHVGS